ncbi:F-box/LRR-repeat protein At4g29420 isoform X1 [Physcomitrium patens]|uniref:F-box domain-containing protein n=2 Tax=Physcomitrium patens TaxID=3218 RepID=A0A7I4C886_PHYPA|nr:F-box/LRR-repeat protein At4g29420-like isoform X1 [Physcomitrium patens]|eukprot:XP_024359856.1 F-box/LRR-repeat protein At4g29420-like isoform X1 [Physcomitrella patens]
MRSFVRLWRGIGRCSYVRVMEIVSERVSCISSMPSPSCSAGRQADGRALELPQYIVDEIVNCVEDARDIAKLSVTCKAFQEASHNVRSMHLKVLNEDHERARIPVDMSSPNSGSQRRNLKDTVVNIVSKKRHVERLRIEVEPRLQSKEVPENERRRTDFWMSDPYFVREWLPRLGATLQHLCIVDYGKQAIMRRSSVLKIISHNCKLVKTLDLRNMYIDTSDCEVMSSMLSMTLRCVKVMGGILDDMNKFMPNLQTLALLGVFGVEKGNLKFKNMKVLCLGLSTPAKNVLMDLPSLEKLQLKMQCPKDLRIVAPQLKYFAFNMEVPEESKVQVCCGDTTKVHATKDLPGGLLELLYGASSFETLALLLERNMRNLRKLYLDIPCMALKEDGTFSTVLKDVPLNLPCFEKLHNCELLQFFNIGPGLWHSMEIHVEQLTSRSRWPRMHTLILHMIPHNPESSLRVLQMILGPSVENLTIYIHKSGPVDCKLMKQRIEEIDMQKIKCTLREWTTSLDFTCFSF